MLFSWDNVHLYGLPESVTPKLVFLLFGMSVFCNWVKSNLMPQGGANHSGYQMCESKAASHWTTPALFLFIAVPTAVDQQWAGLILYGQTVTEAVLSCYKLKTIIVNWVFFFSKCPRFIEASVRKSVCCRRKMSERSASARVLFSINNQRRSRDVTLCRVV